MNAQTSMTKRQKMDMILHQIAEVYGMSFTDFLWEYFRCPDSDGDMIERSQIHVASLETLLQGHGSHTFGEIIGEVLKNPLAQPQDTDEQRQTFSSTQSYLTIEPAVPAITTLAVELIRTRSQKSIRGLVDGRPPYTVPAVSVSKQRDRTFVFISYL